MKTIEARLASPIGSRSTHRPVHLPRPPWRLGCLSQGLGPRPGAPGGTGHHRACLGSTGSSQEYSKAFPHERMLACCWKPLNSDPRVSTPRLRLLSSSRCSLLMEQCTALFLYLLFSKLAVERNNGTRKRPRANSSPASIGLRRIMQLPVSL